jgi:hypothetical protein
MNEPHNDNRSIDVTPAPGDSLDAGLAAGFGRPAQGPHSCLDASQRPVALKEAESDSTHIVKPRSNGMPPPEMTTFAADAKLAAGRQAQHRYYAACNAALAAAGQGGDVVQLDAKQRLALRGQALTWLRAELATWSRLFADGAVGRSRLTQVLMHWQKDPALAGIRAQSALAKLPAEEQQAFAQLWADVATTLQQAEK